MFRDGPIDGLVLEPLKQYSDQRGWLVELFRDDDLGATNRPVMAYVSMTLPGVARGPHEHREQADRFCILGPSSFKLYLWDNRTGSSTYRNRQCLVAGEENPLSIVIPPGVAHAYKNVGDQPGLVYNLPDQLYAGWQRKQPVDEVRYEDDPETPFVLD
jgi:dTDP-4-dehydrorhamnose 3,5-epimerase